MDAEQSFLKGSHGSQLGAERNLGEPKGEMSLWRGVVCLSCFSRLLTGPALQQLQKREQMAVNTQRRNCPKPGGRGVRCP